MSAINSPSFKESDLTAIFQQLDRGLEEVKKNKEYTAQLSDAFAEAQRALKQAKENIVANEKEIGSLKDRITLYEHEIANVES